MKLSDKTDLMERLRAVLSRAGGTKAAAVVLGVEESTVKNRLTGSNPDHPLRFFDALNLLDWIFGEGHEVGQFLEPIVRRYGYLLVRAPAPEVVGDALHAQMTAIAREVGEVAEALIGATDPKSRGGRAITADELANLEKQAGDVQTGVATLVALARQAAGQNVVPLNRGRHG
ncbi:MAG TPA: hypothetical protein VF678_15410 [bacterium]